MGDQLLDDEAVLPPPHAHVGRRTSEEWEPYDPAQLASDPGPPKLHHDQHAESEQARDHHGATMGETHEDEGLEHYGLGQSTHVKHVKMTLPDDKSHHFDHSAGPGVGADIAHSENEMADVEAGLGGESRAREDDGGQRYADGDRARKNVHDKRTAKRLDDSRPTGRRLDAASVKLKWFIVMVVVLVVLAVAITAALLLRS
eukprot:2908671-Rhodomonas_salina.6